MEGTWQDWTAAEGPDRISAEARIALAEAATERAAGVLLDQYHGALRRAVEEILALLNAGDRDRAGEQLDRSPSGPRWGLTSQNPGGWCWSGRSTPARAA